MTNPSDIVKQKIDLALIHLKANPYDMFLGEKDQTQFFQKLIHYPGLVFSGDIYSGSHQAYFSSLILKHISSPQDLFFILDPLEDNKYNPQIFNRTNIVKLNSNPSYVENVIDLCHNEMKERKKKFNKYNIVNIEEYNRKFPPLATTFIVFENFNYILELIDYQRQSDNVATWASKLKEISRSGRAFGVYLIFLSSKTINPPDKIQLPPSLYPGISNSLVFQGNDYIRKTQDIVGKINEVLDTTFFRIEEELGNDLLKAHKDTSYFSYLLTIKAQGLKDIKADPKNLKDFANYSRITMSDEAEAQIDEDFMDYIDKAPKPE